MIDIRTTTVPKREGSGGNTTIVNNGGTSSAGNLYGHSIWGQYIDGGDIKGTLYDVHNIFATGSINTDGSLNSHGVQTQNILTKDITVGKSLNVVSQLYNPEIRMGYDVSNNDNNISIHLCNDEGFYFTDKDRNLGFGIMPDYLSCGLDIGSTNFYSGAQGWRITNDGTAEFQNLKVNGNLDVYSITYNEMKATNGILLVTDAAQILKVVEDENTGDWIFTTDEFPPFAQDDIVQVQYKVSQTRIFQMKGEVVSVAQDGENTVRVAPYNTATGFSYNSTSTSADRLGVTKFTAIDIETCQGKYLIRIGNKSDANRQTIIKLNPYDGGYIDFLADCSTLASAACNDSTANSNKGVSKTRLGELSGVVYNGQALSGYGLYSDNVYLTGGIKNLDNKWQLNRDGSGQVAQNKIYWDPSGNLTIKLSDTSTLDDVINNIQTQINVLPGQITLSVYDDLEGDLRRTGIDISTGKIILSADNTDVSGNLNITGDDSYFQFIDNSGAVKFTMGNTPIPSESDFTGSGTYKYFPYFGASYGVMSGETGIRSIGTWHYGTVSISMHSCMATCKDGTSSGLINLFHPNVQYTLTPVFMKKVGDSYVELARGTTTNSGNFVSGEPTNPIGGGSFTLQSSDMDGATEMEIFVKELWSCSGATMTQNQRHELSLSIEYTSNIVNPHSYIAYNGFGFKYLINNYVFSDRLGTTIKYGNNGGYLKVDGSGTHIKTSVQQPNNTHLMMYEIGTYYVVDGDFTTRLYINKDSGAVTGETYKCIIMRTTGLEFWSSRNCRYKYYINGTYTDITRDSDSDLKLFDIPGSSEVTVMWGGQSWYIYVTALR